MNTSSEKACRRLPPPPSSSPVALSLETCLKSKVSFLAILASFFLLFLLHQTLLSKLSSPTSSSSSSSSSLFSLLPRHSASHASLRPPPPSLYMPYTSTESSSDDPLVIEQHINTNSTLPNKTIDSPHVAVPYLNTTDPNLSFNSTKTVAPPHNVEEEEVRTFHPYGSAAALFVLYSAYRGGNNTFAVIGLGSKPLYVYGKPKFQCYWVPSSSPSTETHSNQSIKSTLAYTMEPDFGFGRVYTVVIVNCTFEESVGTSPQERGGQLVLYASYGDGLGKPDERIVALEESESSYNASMFEPPYPYEYIYCGSPLYLNLNAQRIREWMAYHVMLFGPKSHFIFHDAGGMHEGVRAVLEPWKKLGYITIQNVKQTTQYDGYYFNQFLIVNDCLHRTKFMAEWTFFFDVDEYIYNAPDASLRSVLNWHANHTSISFQQLRMSESLCQFEEPNNDTRWAFEKLVYGEQFNDLKYAVQARNVFATGVHYSQKELGHMAGERGWAWWPHMRFYHYHNTISKPGKLCDNITHNTTFFKLNGRKYDLDTSMVPLAPLAKAFEEAQIGTY